MPTALSVSKNLSVANEKDLHLLSGRFFLTGYEMFNYKTPGKISFNIHRSSESV